MRATAVLPVKRFAAAKQRLAAVLEDAARRALIEAMLSDVLDATSRCRRVDRTVVVTGEPSVIEIARSFGATVVEDRKDRGHSTAATLGMRRMLGTGTGCAVLIPGDCPMLDPDELDHALGRAAPGRVGIVPDRHGSGTNALILTPPNAISPAFGEGSRLRHERLAREAGMVPSIEALSSLALDIDTPDDLAALRERLARDPGRAARTAAALGISDGTQAQAGR